MILGLLVPVSGRVLRSQDRFGVINQCCHKGGHVQVLRAVTALNSSCLVHVVPEVSECIVCTMHVMSGHL